MMGITGMEEEVFQGIPETDQARGILLNADFNPARKARCSVG